MRSLLVVHVFREWVKAVGWRHRLFDLACFHAQMCTQKMNMQVTMRVLRRWIALVSQKHAKCHELARFSLSDHKAAMAALASTYERKLSLLRERQALSDQIASEVQVPEETETAYTAVVAAVERFAEALRVREGQDNLRRVHIERIYDGGRAYTTWEAEVCDQWDVALADLNPEEVAVADRCQHEAVRRLRTKLKKQHADELQRSAESHELEIRDLKAQRIAVQDFAEASIKKLEEQYRLKIEKQLAENEQAYQEVIAQQQDIHAEDLEAQTHRTAILAEQLAQSNAEQERANVEHEQSLRETVAVAENAELSHVAAESQQRAAA